MEEDIRPVLDLIDVSVGQPVREVYHLSNDLNTRCQAMTCRQDDRRAMRDDAIQFIVKDFGVFGFAIAREAQVQRSALLAQKETCDAHTWARPTVVDFDTSILYAHARGPEKPSGPEAQRQNRTHCVKPDALLAGRPCGDHRH